MSPVDRPASFSAVRQGRFQLVQQIGETKPSSLARVILTVQVLGTAGICGDKRQVDIGLHGGGKLHFGLFRRFFEPLQGHLVTSQVDALVFFELVGQKIDEPQVEILTAQVGVTVGGLDLEHPFTDLQDGDVKGAAAQVEYGDFFFAFLSRP
jgi:hypothetical protein